MRPEVATVLTSLASLLLGGGLVKGVIDYRKSKPESDQIVVSAAKDVVLIQAGAMDRQNAQMARQDKEMADLRSLMALLQEQMRSQEQQMRSQERAAAVALAECNAERRELRKERDDERANNWELRSRIEVLEAEVAALRSASEPHPTEPKEPK